MKAKLLSVAVVLAALAAAPPALADSGPGALLAGLQNAGTTQVAAGLSASQQNGVNANVPVSIAGGNVSVGPSAATQTANSAATTNVANNATTNQNQTQQQTTGGNSSCHIGCGGAGGAQVGGQNAQTNQGAVGSANSNQTAVNANVPVSIAGGNVNSGPSSATQTAGSAATTNVSNNATTNQNQSQQQTVGGNSSCHVGCGGAGGAQVGFQNAETNQDAVGDANSNQTAVNANVPVSIAGGDVNSGPSSATQNANSAAAAIVGNTANTNQNQSQQQTVGGNGSCLAGCGGAGAFQAGAQEASTHQTAIGGAQSDQTAVNANVPVSIAGGDVNSGPSSASQNANSAAAAIVGNTATTNQGQSQQQTVGGNSACLAGCGGAGGAQLGSQNAETTQGALGFAGSDQTAVNGNAPVSIAGGDVNSGPSSASQNANSAALAIVGNTATTNQGQSQQQTVGGNQWCLAGCGGAGGAQLGSQNAETTQAAIGGANSNQTAVNGNSPVSIAGGDVNSGPSSASQTANSAALAIVGNSATTNQNQWQQQTVGGNQWCLAGCGGAGAAQLGGQNAQTTQGALGFAGSDQTAVNGNSPVSIAGGDVNSGPSSATQNANSAAAAIVGNSAETNQNQWQQQAVGGNQWCLAGCGSAGGAQLGGQNAETTQGALGFAGSDQTAVNGNSPVSIAGGDVNSGPSSATQNANSAAAAIVGNTATTNQNQWQQQTVGGNNFCLAGCGGAGAAQLGGQNAQTTQAAIGGANSNQTAVNGNSPVSIAGGDVNSGPSSATQNANSAAAAIVGNTATTNQNQWQQQTVGGNNFCLAGCGGAGAAQIGGQNAVTTQLAGGSAQAGQNAVNTNAPHSTAAGNINAGPSTAAQTTSSNAATTALNNAATTQSQGQSQLKTLERASVPAVPGARITTTTTTTQRVAQVAGARTTKTTTQVKKKSAVAGAKTSRTLPFTGTSLPWPLALGVLLMLAGLALRRVSRRDPGELGGMPLS